MIIATHLEIFSFALFSFYVLSGPVRRLMVGRTESTPAEPERKEAKGVSHNE